MVGVQRKPEVESLRVRTAGVDTKHPKDRLFFVASVTSRIDSDGRELTSFSPAFDGEGGDA